ncbi:MAG: hypothetical protein ACI9GW_002354 [Halieaceae bacterium]|jgi:hypothetical protein
MHSPGLAVRVGCVEPEWTANGSSKTASTAHRRTLKLIIDANKASADMVFYYAGTIGYTAIQMLVLKY